MKRINDFLHSEASVLLVLALALLAQTPHTATVFHRLAEGVNGVDWLAWVHASFYAIALEFATLLFVVRGNRRLAWTFAIVSVLANGAYYWHGDMTAAYIASAVLISLALPACIAFYSHDISSAAQIPSVAEKAPSTPVFLPQAAKRGKPTAQRADSDDLTLEKMLEGVNLDGVAGMSKAAVWNGIYEATGSKGTADERTAAQFGVSKRTLQRERLEGDWR